MEVEGTVSEALPNALYRVMLADGTSVLAHLSGQGRMQLVRLLPGDKVKIELSPFDPARGRIKRRLT